MRWSIRRRLSEGSGGLLLPGALRAPPEDLNPQDLVRNYRNRITRRRRIPQRSYRSQLENDPIRWVRTSESNPLYTSVDASRPRTARRYTGGNGGAAGNRTRVRSAYYRRVYRHSPGEPGPAEYREQTTKREGRLSRRWFRLRASRCLPASDPYCARRCRGGADVRAL
jgi:hypothetical protein